MREIVITRVLLLRRNIDSMISFHSFDGEEIKESDSHTDSCDTKSSSVIILPRACTSPVLSGLENIDFENNKQTSPSLSSVLRTRTAVFAVSLLRFVSQHHRMANFPLATRTCQLSYRRLFRPLQRVRVHRGLWRGPSLHPTTLRRARRNLRTVFLDVGVTLYSNTWLSTVVVFQYGLCSRYGKMLLTCRRLRVLFVDGLSTHTGFSIRR